MLGFGGLFFDGFSQTAGNSDSYSPHTTAANTDERSREDGREHRAKGAQNLDPARSSRTAR